MNCLVASLVALLSAVSFCIHATELCYNPKLPNNAKIRRGRKNSYFNGDRVFLKCHRGYSRIGRPVITCRGRRWTKTNFQCAPRSCGNPGALENGVVRSASFTYRSVVRYRCNRGYTLIGPSSRRCLVNQKWQGTPSRCEEKTKECTNIPSIRNAARPPNKVNHGRTLEYRCNAGYVLSSESEQKCHDGVLIGRRPSCVQDTKCPSTFDDENLEILANSKEEGSLAVFRCKGKYRLTGDAVATCKNKKWTGKRHCELNQDSGYIGCYSDMGYYRLHVNADSITNCREECRELQKKFAGLRNGGNCYCSNEYQTKWQEKDCYYKCKFDQSSYCGAYYLYSVYKTDDNKGSIRPVNKTATISTEKIIDKLTPVNYPRSRCRSTSLLHPNGLDLVFVFDASISIGKKNFKLGLEFACRLIEQLGVDYGVDGTRIAAVTFSTWAYVNYNLEDEKVNTVRRACAETRAIPYIGRGSGTRFGLALVVRDVKPLFRDRGNRALVLITDGKWNSKGESVGTARTLKQKHNVEIFAIAVGRKVLKREIMLMVSDRDCHYFHLKSNDDFTRISEKIINRDYTACGEGGVGSRGRIMGGETADSTNGTQWPWQVAIYRNFDFVCGGSLIRDNVVLTAAHCLMNKARNRLLDTPNSYRVVVGELKINRMTGIYAKSKSVREKWLQKKGREIKAIFQHQSYRMASQDYQNDIALFQLEEPVKGSPEVLPVCLPSASQYVENGLHGYVSGWGYTNKEQAVPESLHYVLLRVQSNKTCKLDSKKEKLMFCAGEADGKKDSCKGDSGGPFVVRLPDNVEETKFSFKVVGIVSNGPRCGRTGEYGFYTRVGHYVNWIKGTISKMK